MTKIPHIKNLTHGVIPYDQPRDHAVGGVQDGGTVVASPAAVAVNPTVGLAKRTQTGAAPIHPSMKPGNRGHAVRYGDAPAQPITAHSDTGKRVSVPEMNPGAKGRIMTADPHYKPSSHEDGIQYGDRVLDEAIDQAPGSHPSHTSNMKPRS